MKACTQNKADVAPAQSGQHTPGPWYYAKLLTPENHMLTRIDFEIRPPDSHCGIAYMVCGQDASKEDQRANPREVEANARLIAAAPELLEALKILVQSPEIRQEDMQQARAAIAKASH